MHSNFSMRGRIAGADPSRAQSQGPPFDPLQYDRLWNHA
jgi:hypothetical protein